MIDSRIIEFIADHHVMTLASRFDEYLWCANLFYAFFEEESTFVVTSDITTRHAQNFNKNPEVAGSVVLETEKVGMIRGMQFRGVVSQCSASLFDRYRLIYLKRFPYAVLKGGDVWRIRLTEIKYTDNRLGFGTKLLWRGE